MRSDPVADPDRTVNIAGFALGRSRLGPLRFLVPEMPCAACPSLIRRLVARTRQSCGVVAITAVLALPGGAIFGQGFAGIGFFPRQATASIRASTEATGSPWISLALDAIELGHGAIRAGWGAGEQLRLRLAPESTESYHAIGPGGRHWLHVFPWSDPVAVEFGLQRLGSRPMGGGRFRIPSLGLELAIANEWIIIGPTGCPWLDAGVDQAMLDAIDVADPELDRLVEDLPDTAVEVLLRHDEPIGGMSAIAIQPTSGLQAHLELAGFYGASPLPIRPVTSLDVELTGRFDGRVAFATIESGIGLVDPLMIQHAAAHPAIVPDADVRMHFASQRLLVIDGESARIDPLGIVEVPAACVAVPMRIDRAQPSNAELRARIDAWMESAGRAMRSTWNAETSGPIRTRGGDIRHFSFGPGFIEACEGHPMAIGASLNWTLHAASDGGRWLVAGTSPGLVRRVTATLDERSGPPSLEAIAGAGMASPARLAIQIAELGQLRGLRDDRDANDDSNTLAATAALLERVERVRWSTSRQDERSVRATAEIRLMPAATGEDGIPIR
jgi:hypothetical protein